MCGIVGHVTNSVLDREFIKKGQILHLKRGPDSGGVYETDSAIFGHRRLSILDLSHAGHQPFVSDPRYIMVFNGEIYNHIDLRTDLENPCQFQGSSDTESLYYSIIQRGFEETLRRCDGMYSVVFLDQQEKLLYFSRDDYGEKPLYFSHKFGNFYFSSSLASFAGKNFDMDSVSEWLKFGHNTSNCTMLEGVESADPNYTYVLKLSNWTIKKQKKIEKGLQKFQTLLHVKKDQDIVSLAEDILRNSVKSRMVSDVPVGVLLSGGIDSSLIAWKAKELDSNVETFSLIFDDPAYNERKFSKFVANELKTHHHEILFDEKEFLSNLGSYFDAMDHPISDQTTIPQYALCKSVASQVKVALSGDGADELFLGYPKYFGKETLRYIAMRKLINKNSKILVKLANFLRISPINHNRITRLIEDSKTNSQFRNYSIWSNSTIRELLGYDIHSDQKNWISDEIDFRTWDIENYLGRSLLIKTDLTSMAHSLEVRSPFLSPEMRRLSEYLITNEYESFAKKKYVWKKLSSRRFGQDFAYRKKAGFSFPIDAFLRRNMHAILSVAGINLSSGRRAIVDNRIFTFLVNEQLAGKNYGVYLWSLIMLENLANKIMPDI